MNGGGYKIRNKTEIHFLTFAVVEWVDVFTRKDYRDIAINSLTYCQEAKGLLLHGWCLMTNHFHLLVSSKEGLLSEILRDFKKFTSKKIVEAIAANPLESRREWMLPGNNGFQRHHAVDLYLTGLFYVVSRAFPVGWGIGALYFLGNEAFKHFNDGKSITETIFD